MTGAPSKRRLAAAKAETDKRQKEADDQTEALKRTRERAGRRGMLGFVSDFVTPGSKTLGGG